MGRVLRIFRDVGRGINRVGELVKPDDFPFWQKPVAPMRFEIEAVLNGVNYAYALALELPKDFRELRVLEERLTVDGLELFSRQQGKVSLNQASFVVVPEDDANRDIANGFVGVMSPLKHRTHSCSELASH